MESIVDEQQHSKIVSKVLCFFVSYLSRVVILLHRYKFFVVYLFYGVLTSGFPDKKVEVFI